MLAAVEKPKGILLFVSSLAAGGAERQLVDMANHWSDRKVAVTLVTLSGPEVPDFYALSASVRRVHLRGPQSPVQGVWRIVRALRRVIAAERPRTVVSFITENNVLALLATLGLPVRIIVSERAHPQFDTTVTFSWRLLRRLFYRRAHLVVAQTSATAAWVAKNCGARVAVVPNALRPLADVECPREPLILGVGRLTRQKGFDLLLRAFARLRPRFPQWRVAILGVGPERGALQALGESLRIDDVLRFEGTDPAIEPWMARAGLVVQPSRFEGFPNVVLEAMGSGAAVVSGDCQAGPRDLIADGVNGLLVPVDDVDALETAMRRLMSDGALRERLGREARKVRESFSQEKIMTKWNSIV